MNVSLVDVWVIVDYRGNARFDLKGISVEELAAADLVILQKPDGLYVLKDRYYSAGGIVNTKEAWRRTVIAQDVKHK